MSMLTAILWCEIDLFFYFLFCLLLSGEVIISVAPMHNNSLYVNFTDYNWRRKLAINFCDVTDAAQTKDSFYFTDWVL